VSEDPFALGVVHERSDLLLRAEIGRYVEAERLAGAAATLRG
jgi:hypothetical protein